MNVLKNCHISGDKDFPNIVPCGQYKLLFAVKIAYTAHKGERTEEYYFFKPYNYFLTVSSKLQLQLQKLYISLVIYIYIADR